MSKQQQQRRWRDGHSTAGDNVYEVLAEPLTQRKKVRAAPIGPTTPPPLPPPRATPPAVRGNRFSKAESVTIDPTAAAVTSQSPPLIQTSLPTTLPIQLSTIVTEYPGCIPMRVKIQTGYYGNSTELFIAQNEVLNLNFIKHVDVITLKYDCGKKELSVPLNSWVEFAVIYDPNKNEAEAMEGFLFDTVEEIVACKTLPLVIKATRAFRGSCPESSVEAGELLLLTGVKTSSKGRGSGKGKGKHLQARSLTDKGREKCLNLKCAGAFSTKPGDIRMKLAAMVRHKFTFPQTVLVFPDSTLDRVLPAGVANSPVTLEGCKLETSVVATMTSPGADTENQPVLDIHLSMEIEVVPVKLSDSEQLQLAQDTLALYKSFDISDVQVYVEKPNNKIYDAQVLLYKHVARDEPDIGIHLKWPLTLQEDVQAKSPKGGPLPEPPETPIAAGKPPTAPLEYTEPVTSSAHPQQPNSTERVYQVINPRHDSKVESTYTPLAPQSPVASSAQTNQAKADQRSESSVKGSLTEMRSQVVGLSNRLDREVQKLELADKGASGAIVELTRVCTQIQERLQHLETFITSKAHLPSSNQNSRTADAAEENREFLASLDSDTVLALLDAMNLSQYRERFHQEQVTGDVLLDCDEDILENELHVSSRIHRLRFTKLISGKVSARDILNNAK